MCRLIKKTRVKLVITLAIAVSGHDRVNLKAFARCSSLHLNVLGSWFIKKNLYWPKNMSKIKDDQNKNFP